MIQKTQADVLIIDPWRLWLGADENDAERVVKGLRALSSLRESRPTLTIIIIHHVRKDRSDFPRKLLTDPNLWVESVSGHHALPSHVDACYGLERQREGNGEDLIVFAGIARNTDPRVLLLEDDEETLRFEVRQKCGCPRSRSHAEGEGDLEGGPYPGEVRIQRTFFPKRFERHEQKGRFCDPEEGRQPWHADRFTPRLRGR